MPFGNETNGFEVARKHTFKITQPLVLYWQWPPLLTGEAFIRPYALQMNDSVRLNWCGAAKVPLCPLLPSALVSAVTFRFPPAANF